MYINTTKDQLLTDFGKTVLYDRYLTPNQSPQERFYELAKYYGVNAEHTKRMYEYISNLWFMPATPILSNGGTNRGLPISCFLNTVGDTLRSITSKWGENAFLGCGGGGIGTDWSQVRSLHEEVSNKGKSSGIIPFIKVMDSMTGAINQGAIRRGAAAAYLDIFHPEIEEFIELRKPTGDVTRRAMHLHHGVNLTNEFMECVHQNLEYPLVDPKSGKVIKKIQSRELFEKILETRMQTGEPYTLFIDTVNNSRCSHHKVLNLKIRQSNLCTEIMEPTGIDRNGNDRTAVCCLGSVNLEYWDDWKDNKLFIEDCLLFLSQVLKDFIKKCKDAIGYSSAVYSAVRERSVGLGVLGFHSLLQSKSIPFESALAKSLNSRIFHDLRENAEKADFNLVKQFGACPDAAAVDMERFFSYKLAIAPTASISIIAGSTSPCIEPWSTNIFTHKTSSGSFEVKNKYLENLLISKNLNTEKVWDQILQNDGSVQSIQGLTDYEKQVFKTAFEIDQRWIIDLAADRAPLIDQGQSINLFINEDIHKWDLFQLHYQAWKRGIKSLYYLRSKSKQRAGFAGGVEKDNTRNRKEYKPTNYEECLTCQ